MTCAGKVVPPKTLPADQMVVIYFPLIGPPYLLCTGCQPRNHDSHVISWLLSANQYDSHFISWLWQPLLLHIVDGRTNEADKSSPLKNEGSERVRRSWLLYVDDIVFSCQLTVIIDCCYTFLQILVYISCFRTTALQFP